MRFVCLENKEHKFAVDKPQEIEGNWLWRGIVHCPYCGTEDLEEDMQVVTHASSSVDLGNARKENLAMTMDARKQASAASAELNRRDPEVTLAPIQGASAYGKSAPVKVRKSLMDSLAAKAPDNILKGE